MAKAANKPESETQSAPTVDINAVLASLGTVAQQLSAVAAQLATANDSKAHARKQEDKRKNHSRELAIRIAANEKELLAGEKFFKVSLPNEPVMARFVGVEAHRDESTQQLLAQKKYTRYFGIRHLSHNAIDGGTGISIEPIDSIPSLQDEASWLCDIGLGMQLKNLRDGAAAEAEAATAV